MRKAAQLSGSHGTVTSGGIEERRMKKKGYRGKAFWIMVLGSLLVLSACAAPQVRIMPVVGVSAYAPTDPATVTVLRTEPQLHFETLGQIILEPESALSVPEIEQRLREAAAGMGANAVVIQSDMKMQAGEDRPMMSGGQIITAIAIRYRK